MNDENKQFYYRRVLPTAVIVTLLILFIYLRAILNVPLFLAMVLSGVIILFIGGKLGTLFYLGPRKKRDTVARGVLWGIISAALLISVLHGFAKFIWPIIYEFMPQNEKGMFFPWMVPVVAIIITVLLTDYRHPAFTLKKKAGIFLGSFLVFNGILSVFATRIPQKFCSADVEYPVGYGLVIQDENGHYFTVNNFLSRVQLYDVGGKYVRGWFIREGLLRAQLTPENTLQVANAQADLLYEITKEGKLSVTKDSDAFARIPEKRGRFVSTNIFLLPYSNFLIALLCIGFGLFFLKRLGAWDVLPHED